MTKVKWKLLRSADSDNLEIRASMNLPKEQVIILRILIPEATRLDKFMSQTKLVRKNMRIAIMKKYEYYLDNPEKMESWVSPES